MPGEVATAGRLLLSALVPALLAGCEVATPTPVASQPSLAPPPVATPVTAASPSVAPGVHVDLQSGASPAETGPGAYRYHVEVPQLVGLPAPSLAIDAAIRATLQRHLDAFLDAARDGPAGPAPSDLTCTSRTVRLTARLAVLRVDCAEYQAGAAHPSTVTHAFNCNLATWRILTLQDLFSPGSAYLGVLSATAQDQLRTKLAPADEDALVQGTAPVADNFRVFMLGAGALVLVFARYQVAPGAAGELEVSIPLTELRRYLAAGVLDLGG